MVDDRGHLRAMRLLPFAAAVDKTGLTPTPVDLGVVGPSRLPSGLMFVIVCLTSCRTDG